MNTTVYIDRGKKLTVEITRGMKGQNGLSAYEIAVENGFVGTEEEWLLSLSAGGVDLTPYATKVYVEEQIGAIQIPALLADLQDDATHRLVTDAEKSAWNAKQPAGDYATNTSLTNGLAGKVDKVTGKELSENDYTDAEKTKLAGVADNANNYTHPANHAPTIITQDANNRFVTDTEKATWNGKSNFSGSYNDLTNKPDIPTDTNQLINGAGFITLSSVTKAAVGLANCDNTSDANKPVSTATQTALSAKADLATMITALAAKQARIDSNGLLKGTGLGSVEQAVAGVDYSDPDHDHTDTYEPVNTAIMKNTSAIDCNGQQLQDFDAEVVEKTDSYALSDGDRGKVFYYNSASGCTFTVPDSLGVGFTCTVIQYGAGQVAFAASGSMTLRNRQSHTKSYGQYSAVALVVPVANNCILQGDTAA